MKQNRVDIPWHDEEVLFKRLHKEEVRKVRNKKFKKKTLRTTDRNKKHDIKKHNVLCDMEARKLSQKLRRKK
tara:strand:+ start:328 stop:543 length:216 start_codon:yes stop_codon:yes gene_type:complete